MSGSTKEVWVTPELVVLVRSGLEEAVLDACKYTIKAGMIGPNVVEYGNCDNRPDYCAEEACSAIRRT